MEEFLIAVVGSVGVMLALILASQHRAGARTGDAKPGAKGRSAAAIACVGILLLATLAYAGFSTMRWRTAEGQWHTAEAQRQALEAQVKQMAASQHRAWVYATPSLAGPMIIKDHAVSLAAHYTLENTGDAPAVDMQIASSVVPDVERDVLALQKSQCAQLPADQTQAAQTQAAPAQDSLFPNQSRAMTRNEGVAAEIVDRQFARQGTPHTEFWWVGCVGYKTLGSATRHYSGFIYEIAEPGAGPRGIVPISLADRIIPKSRLVVVRYPGGGFAAD
ncbi:MAG TPA: hypothetical protein VNF04_06280 [Stellaceae bacterium]|nr:hypothetical protein [Stellaceae bacterium]